MAQVESRSEGATGGATGDTSPQITAEGEAPPGVDPPIVSVVMPVYNCRAYVADAVRSILWQTFADFELIVVDDGSTDGSSQILDELARSDHRIILLRHPNAGMTRAMNEGVERARGEFIARMDADDISLPTRLQKQLDYLRAHPECVAVGSAIVMMDSYGNPLYLSRWPESHEDSDAALLRGRSDGGLAHPAATIRTTGIRAIGGYREKFKYAQDKDLWLRLGEIGRLANLPEPLLKYRMHGTSTASTRAAPQRAEFEEAIVEACQRRGITPPPRPPPPLRASLLSFPGLRAQFAMYAIQGCNFRVARQHAFAHARSHPVSPRSWLLVALALTAPIIQRIRGKERFCVAE
ncbi:MAG TPA: glycosyltransferase [Tepidisphaeraceae bacterium]|jgi:GT2 family glycosyltransferase|nr:glycosyltransferase [Tepidisphaeraceae bacterium]